MFSLLHFKSLRQRLFDLLQIEWFPPDHSPVLHAAGYVQLDAIIVNGKTVAAGTDSCVMRISKPMTFACFSPRKGRICLSAFSIQFYFHFFWQEEQLKGVIILHDPEIVKGSRKEMSEQKSCSQNYICSLLVVTLTY